MFKYDKGGLLNPINNLFAVSNERHNYNTRHNHDMQINAGNGKIVYTLVSFRVYGIKYPKKIKLMYHTHVSKT